MEATALSVGKSVLSGALGYAKSAIAAEVALQLGVERDQAFISDELEMMQAFLMAAHEERDDNRVVQIWVKQVRDVAYDVEDSLQDFAIRLQNQSWWRFLRTLLDRRHVAKEMKDLRAKVEDVSQRNVRYRLIRGGSGSKPVTLGGHSIISSEVALHIAEAAREALREKKKVDLLKLIAKDDENELKAIAVWGASNDVGVTSIIRAAYEDQLVKHKFKCRAWVRLLHPFSPNDFFASLVRQFHGDQLEQSEKATEGSAVGLEVMKDMATQDNLVDVFNRYVTEMKYLVVVTDVSTVEEWDWIKTYFPSKNGSRIIVSTLQFEVASLCTEQPYTVSEIDQQWSPEKDFYVFYKKVDTPTKKDDMTSEAEISSAEPSAGEQHAKKFTRAGTMVAAAAAAFEDDQLIDRAAAKAEVVRLIALDGEVMAICGMGGLGKTTLARSVYQQELAEKFQRRAWLSISGSFNPNEFQSNLFQQLRNDHQEKADKLRSDADHKEQTHVSKKKKETEEETIRKKLTKILLEQKCLIVLDDVPSTVEWQDIKQRLPPRGGSGSRIIVTTRQRNVAIGCSLGENKIYDIGLLTKPEATELFRKKVFRDINEKEYLCYYTPSLTEQEDLILDKCDGLPLAISTIGSFLATKPKTAAEWTDLNRHISAELEMNPELNMLKSVLTSSYDGLPYHLKSPFLYFSIFPQAHCIRWTRLVRRWIAEGYSTETRNITAEESGTKKITELINRNMVRASKGSSQSTARIGSLQAHHGRANKGMNRSSKGSSHRARRVLQVHDLIREIGISNAAEENLVFTLENGCKFSTQGRIRHLAVSSSWTRDKNAFERAVDLSHIRSLTVFGGLESFLVSSKMRLLRVLDLEDATGLKDHHLSQIGEFVHLNYLSLRRCDGIFRLPNSIGNLGNLHTLDVRDTSIINLPTAIVKLQRLQYLRVGFVPEHDEEESGRFGPLSIQDCQCNGRSCCGCCCNLICLPLGLVLLLVCLFCFLGFFLWVLSRDGLDGLRVAFKGVDPQGVKLPRGVRKLKALHTMGIVNIDGGAYAIIEDLRHLTQLRKLRVTGINKKNSKDFFSAIANHRCLESLLVRAEGDLGLSGILHDASLPCPPVDLRSLKLYGNLGMLPQWINRLENLAKMELRSSRISEVTGTLKILGALQNLAILRLGRNWFQNEEKVISLNFLGDTFKTLVELEMDLPSNIPSLGFGEGAMPVLKLVSFNLSGYSDKEPCTAVISGLDYLVSLKELVLSGNQYNDVEGLRRQLRFNPEHPVVKIE